MQNHSEASPAPHGGWRIHADRGGTFTDIIGIAPDGSRHTHKLLSHAPGQYEDAVIAGTRALLGLASDADVAEGQVAELRLGTTVTTNALLEGRHHPCALVINSGFEDLLAIGDQSRDDIFALAIAPRTALCARVAGVATRRAADGQCLLPLDPDALQRTLQALRDEGIDSLAIALMHGAHYPDEEQAIATAARAAGFTHLCCSHWVSTEAGLLARAQTTVVEAALAPILQRYTQRLASQLPGARIRCMQSDGNLADAAHFHARNSIFSGPAGGVIGATRIAAAGGVSRIVGLDMGGTSTDVFHAEGSAPVRSSVTVAGQQVRAPALDLHTVAAGGGSQVFHDGARMRVGPESAGAAPGPACYGRGGPATITDANLLLGRIYGEGFAPVFGPDGNAPLDAERAYAAFAALLGDDADPSRVNAAALGALRLAVEQMAGAVRRVSVARGVDITAHCLVAFGGAGGQHACEVAEALGMQQVMLPQRASVLSALGVGMAALGVTVDEAIDAPLDAHSVARAAAAWPELHARAERSLAEQNTAMTQCSAVMRLHYEHAETVLEIGFDTDRTAAGIAEQFHAAHHRDVGFSDPARPIHVVGLRLRAQDEGQPVAADTARPPRQQTGTQTMMLSDGQWHPVPVYEHLDAQEIEGPALVLLAQSNLVLPPGWTAHADAHGIHARRGSLPAVTKQTATAARLELFNHRFMQIACEMGDALQRSAHSVNVRNRLDYSCALFDRDGQLVANAPHIPVHLGSMSAAVQAVLRQQAKRGESLEADAAWLINDPYTGGTHLPDLTLIMPVFVADRDRPVAFVAARAHHADVGGISPGSMPASSTSIDEEGIRIAGLRVARHGRLDEDLLRATLTQGPHPARNPEANLADLRAQLASCTRGVGLVQSLCAQHGVDTVMQQMQQVQDYAAQAVADFLHTLPSNQRTVDMDDGQRIQVATQVREGRLHLDFSGTSAADTGNANTPLPVVRAAVMYALRCVIAAPLPLNEGFLRHVVLSVPEPSLLAPQPPSAVVAGNVESSQAVTDALLAAFGAMAESQGTMNNISFGNARHQYYETLCGGAGAGPGFDGASAVHTHMTNSRITDPEIIERQQPVRVEHFGLRPHSGGDGQWRGGDGVCRVLRFLEAVELAVISNRRRHPARGMAGGGDGQLGENWLIAPDGKREPLPARVRLQVEAGSCLEVLTPGGGGWGPPCTGEAAA
ncbi:hydantoinase B/oxoprolinase family protein [Algiphilus sp.]|uniref:hydantoinase B/oxoprolinase family protein n=1 Tax=Algiphilus sp. TaxID=1872431 RepID=UPI0032ED86A8